MVSNLKGFLGVSDQYIFPPTNRCTKHYLYWLSSTITVSMISTIDCADAPSDRDLRTITASPCTIDRIAVKGGAIYHPLLLRVHYKIEVSQSRSAISDFSGSPFTAL
ncbi:hypothetical protein Q1695_012113 [Nippostrongylus brasiliensis]|nr:hypothetical protein Q1695_012113 [Nippostrongylus brasiliensis]